MKNLSYKDAGVDIDKGDSLVEKIKPLAQATRRDGVLAGIGGFGALFEISKRYRDPVLVSGTDGVGTKLKLAFSLNRHDTVGIDLVAMSVNDILVQGAEPLFFLDYFACGKLDINVAEQVISGIAEGCKLSDCALIGGETAEMPDMYPAGEYDLAGFAVGVVEKSAIIDGGQIEVGDVVIGLNSSGIHSNGFSLVRKILALQPDILQQQINDLDNSQISVSDALMRPTRIYVKAIRQLQKSINIKGMAHITGGGIVGNLPRILNDHLSVEINSQSWQRAEIFNLLQKLGNVTDDEMYQVFNCGIGFAIIVSATNISATLDILQGHGEKAQVIGKIVKSNGQTEVIIT